MKRYLEIGIVLVVCAVVVSMTTQWRRNSGTQQPPTPSPTTPGWARSPSSFFALNGVSIGDDVNSLEARLGAPDYAWPERMVQQWEPRQGDFTRIAYLTDAEGSRIVSGVEAGGVLSRGTDRVFGFGDPKEVMLNALGEPTRVEDDFIFHYPGLSISCQEQIGMITLGENFGMGADRELDTAHPSSVE